jgi:hypothetical protein
MRVHGEIERIEGGITGENEGGTEGETEGEI